MKYTLVSAVLFSVSLAFAGPAPCTKVSGECDGVFEPVKGRKTKKHRLLSLIPQILKSQMR